MAIKEIKEKERKELEKMLAAVKKKHPRKRKRWGFILNDFGNGIAVAKLTERGSVIDIPIRFCSYCGMWHELNARLAKI